MAVEYVPVTVGQGVLGTPADVYLVVEVVDGTSGQSGTRTSSLARAEALAALLNGQA